MSLITTALGLVLIFLILSLLASSIQEALASWLSLRGRTFGEALERMLTNVELKDGQLEKLDDSLLQAFRKHNIFRQLLPQKGWYHYSRIGDDKNPSYLSSSTFSEIMVHVMKARDFEGLKKYVDEMGEGELKTYFQDLVEDANGDIHVFRNKLESWYNDMMDRASGWYKRHVHNFLLVIGLIMALVFNADTFSMYNKVSSIKAGSTEEQAIWSMAQDYIDAKENTFNSQLSSFKSIVDSLEKVPDSIRDLSALVVQDSLLRKEQQVLIADLQGDDSPLGLGWKYEEWEAFKNASWYTWLIKLLGMLITTMAISLGAPFWFDLLKKIVNIRNAGNYSRSEPKMDTNVNNGAG